MHLCLSFASMPGCIAHSPSGQIQDGNPATLEDVFRRRHPCIVLNMTYENVSGH